MRVLLENGGMDVNATNDNGDNALLLVCLCYEKSNLIDIVRLLLQKGIDVNAVNEVNRNALHMLYFNYVCVSEGNNLMGIVRLLLEYGARVNARDKFGKYAREDYEAVDKNEIVKLLN